MKTMSAEFRLGKLICKDGSNVIARAITHVSVFSRKPFLMELENGELGPEGVLQRQPLSRENAQKLNALLPTITREYAIAMENSLYPAKDFCPPEAASIEMNRDCINFDSPRNPKNFEKEESLNHLIRLIDSICKEALLNLTAQLTDYSKTAGNSTSGLPVSPIIFAKALHTAFDRGVNDIADRKTFLDACQICYVRCLNDALGLYGRMFPLLVSAEAAQAQDESYTHTNWPDTVPGIQPMRS